MKTVHRTISVLLATKNRPSQIYNCVKSLLRSTYNNFEIILVDQSTTDETYKVISSLHANQLKYIHSTETGKTKSINKAIRIASGEIISLTDDDHIVDKDWLNNIHTFFTKKMNIYGVFGKILPFEPHLHQNQICPSIFTSNEKKIVNNIYITHYEELGLGNNMSLRKIIFNKIGYFKEWLGPGAFNFAGGEDGEFIYRILKNNFTLAYEPSILVYHNRWLSYDENSVLQGRYTGGEIAYNLYYFLNNDKQMGEIALKAIYTRIFNVNIKPLIKSVIKHNIKSDAGLLIKGVIFTILEITSIIEGTIVAMYIKLKEL